MEAADFEDRVKTQRLIAEMMEEALDAYHRRLVALSGENLIEVLTFLILKYRELRTLKEGEMGSIIYVDYYEESGETFKSLLERLEASNFPIEGIRHHTYEESNRLLGTTNDILIMDMSCGARPNDIGRLVETVRGGGLIILCNLNLKADRPWETTIHKSLAHPPYQWSDLKTRFERFFVRKLMEAQGVWILNGWRVLKGEMLHPPKAVRRRLEIPSEEIGVPKRLYRLAFTEEQAKALQIIGGLMREVGESVLLVTSNRGRGKSALLGLSAAMLLYFGARKIIVTAPTGDESQIVFGMIENGLSALKEKFFREQRDEQPRIKCRRGSVEFMLPQRALRETADILMVDEAAGIPVPLLLAFTERFPKIIFASTVHGYEGAGRGFSLRFLKTLQGKGGINLFRIELKEPIRYAPDDPVESWLYDALLLDAEPADIDPIKFRESGAEDYRYERVDLDRWFEMDEKRLREFIGIYVLAHYRNRPDDLLILGDSPHHSARAVTAKSGEIVAALHLAEEGRMDEEMINLVLAGNPPSGNLIPSCIAKYYPPHRDFAHLRGLRVVRIAVHPEITGRGIGSLALKSLSDEASKSGFDWIGASFGADRLLLNFWLKNGFIPVHLSPMRNIVSGEYSVIVVKPLNVRAEEAIKNIYVEFKLRLLNSLPDTYFNLEPGIAVQLLGIGRWGYLERPILTPSQKERLLSYVRESLAYEGSCDAIRQILIAHFMSSGEFRAILEERAEIALIARCLQCRSWDRTAHMIGMHPNELKSNMREYIGKIIEHYWGIRQ